MNRILALALLVALVLVGFTSTAVQADAGKDAVIRAQGNAYHINFVSSANKRADLRVNVATKGVDAAFTEWLKREHPAAYKEGIARAGAKQSRSEESVRFASSYCCKKGGGCCRSNCGQCCAKGSCTMGCCGMDVCKKMRHTCCK